MALSPFLRVLYEERTMRMIVLPFGSVATAAAMTVLATREAGTLEQTLLISNAMNNANPEPWSTWIARYFLWHVLALSITSFKRRALPEPAWWVPDTTAVTMLVALWSSFHQLPLTTIRPFMSTTHNCSAFALFLTFPFETVIVWWPLPSVAIPYFVVVACFVITYVAQDYGVVSMYDTGIPFVRDRWELFLEWLLVGAHFLIVWWRFPVVEAEMKTGVWKPWFGIPCRGRHLEARLRRELSRDVGATALLEQGQRLAEDDGRPATGDASKE